MAIPDGNQQEFQLGWHGYKIDYSAVAGKSRCVAGIGHII
jgi:hypothetical protein